MKLTLFSIAAVLFSAQAVVAQSAPAVTTTIIAPPCSNSTASADDIVTRSPVSMPSGTNCATFTTIPMSGSMMSASATKSGMMSGKSSATGSSMSATFTGGAGSNVVGKGGVAALAVAAGALYYL